MVVNLIRACVSLRNYSKAISMMHHLLTLRGNEGVEIDDLESVLNAIISSSELLGAAEASAVAAASAAVAAASLPTADGAGVDGITALKAVVAAGSVSESADLTKSGRQYDNIGNPASVYVETAAKLLGHITSVVSRNARVRLPVWWCAIVCV